MFNPRLAILALSLFTLVPAALPVPAAAIGPDGSLTTICGYGQTCTGAIVAEPLPNGSNAEEVSFSCAVVTPYLVQATGAACSLNRADTGAAVAWSVAGGIQALYVNGQVSAASGVATGVPVTAYNICVFGGIVAVNGFPSRVANPSCFSPLLLASA